MCPLAWPLTPSGFRARNHRTHEEKSEFGLADRTWLESMYRKYGRRSLWVGSHIDARIPDVDAEQLIDPAWLDYHSSQQRPPVPPVHPVNFTRRIACDLSEGVGRDSTCIVVVDDWGVLEVVLGSSMGLPEAAETIHRLAARWNVPHDKISFDKLGIGRNFPNHLAVGASRWRSPTPGRASHKTQAHSSTWHRGRLEAAQSAGRHPFWILECRFWIAECGTQIGFNPKFKIPNPKSLGATTAVPLLPWPVLCPAGR